MALNAIVRIPIVFGVLACLGAAKPALGQIAHSEVIRFESTTLTDQEFLTGSKGGKPVTLTGMLRLPAGTDKVPVAVLLHGSGGIHGYVTGWETDYNALGMGSFVIDSFAGRGIFNTLADQFQLGRLAMIVDAYRALEVLARHPRVDPSRIVLMGFSRGGQAALYAGMKRFHRMHGPAALSFAAFVPLYANCGTRFVDDDDRVDRPVRLFHGSADDYVAIAPCRSYVQRLKAQGRDVRLTEYADAGHMFDFRIFQVPWVGPDWQTFRKCVLAETASGVIVNTRTGQAFANGDPCIELGPTAAYNEMADRAVRAAVAEFMKLTVAKK